MLGTITLRKSIWKRGSYLKNCFRLLLLLTLISVVPMTAQAQIKYNHDSPTISEIEDKVNFKVFTPSDVPEDWTLEIKTYPVGKKDNIAKFRLHYMDKHDEHMMVGIEQKNANDIENKHPYAQKVEVNGHTAYFVEWGNSGEMDSRGKVITGGLLYWSQKGTYIEMDSSILDRDNMLEIANSMN